MGSGTAVSSGLRNDAGVRPARGGAGKMNGRETPMRQATTSALDDRLRDGLSRVGSADLLVGIPSFNNAATVGHVARTVAEGLRAHFPDSSPVIVNADGGSKDETSDVVPRATEGVPTITGAYVGPPGKGSAFRAIFEVATELGVEACAVVDSDLRTITPARIPPLITPVPAGQAGYVTPPYAPPQFDGTLPNNLPDPPTPSL